MSDFLLVTAVILIAVVYAICLFKKWWDEKQIEKAWQKESAFGALHNWHSKRLLLSSNSQNWLENRHSDCEGNPYRDL